MNPFETGERKCIPATLIYPRACREFHEETAWRLPMQRAPTRTSTGRHATGAERRD